MVPDSYHRKAAKVRIIPVRRTKVTRVFNKLGVVVQDDIGFRYHRRSQTKSGDDIYSCVSRRKLSCKARMKVRGDVIVVKMDEHNHDEIE